MKAVWPLIGFLLGYEIGFLFTWLLLLLLT